MGEVIFLVPLFLW